MNERERVATLRPEDVDRFWSKVRKTDECWLWTERPTTQGGSSPTTN